jgi:hypothetical protein
LAFHAFLGDPDKLPPGSGVLRAEMDYLEEEFIAAIGVATRGVMILSPIKVKPDQVVLTGIGTFDPNQDRLRLNSYGERRFLVGFRTLSLK